jgi:hypothetical protein
MITYITETSGSLLNRLPSRFAHAIPRIPSGAGGSRRNAARSRGAVRLPLVPLAVALWAARE